MTTKEKYELFDKTKINEKVLGILKNMQESSKNFTDESVNSKIDSALDKLIENFRANKPEALLTLPEAKKEVKKEKEKAIKKNEGKDLSDKKDTDDKTGLPKKDTLEERKDIIKEESETEKEARDRAKKELEKEKEKAKDEIESQIEKLNRLIQEDPALRGFNTGTAATGGGRSTPIIDAERKALPRGSRVSHKGWKNQYGASDGGRKYWENRENRSDRKSPEYETGKPYLEKGGYMADGGETDGNVVQYGDKVILTLDDLGEKYKGMQGEIMPTKLLNDKYSIKLENGLTMAFDKGEFRHNSINPKYAKGGMMADGGMMNRKELNKKIKDWYITTYPTDKEGKEINDKITFKGFWAYLSQGYDVYDVLEVADSLIRERVFGKLSEIYAVDYDVVYNMWLRSDKYDKGGQMADGGMMKSNNIDAELKDFNLDDLDEFENMQFNQYYPSLGKVGALQVLINNVEGDYSQLSTELSELAEKQISNEEWDKESMRRYGYAEGGMMADGDEVEGVDLFEDYDDQPIEVQAILANYQMEDNDYETLQNLKAELESIGYTMEFGLDAEPYDLRKIGEKGKSEFYAKGGETDGDGFGSWESLTIEKMQKDFPFKLNQLNRLLKDAGEKRDDAVITNFALSWQSKKYDTHANLVYEAGIYLKSTGSDNVSPSGTYHSQKGLSITFYLRQTYQSNGSMSSISINASKTVAGGMGTYKSIDVANYSDIYKYISAILRDNPKNNLDNFAYAKGGGVPYKPYGKTKGRFKLTYEVEGEPQSEIRESLEEAMNSAKRYCSPKLGYTDVHIYDESGKEYFFADGGQVDFNEKMAKGGITPQLNDKVHAKAQEILKAEGITENISQKQFNQAYDKVIKEFGYSPGYFKKVMREFGPEYPDDDDSEFGDFMADGGKTEQLYSSIKRDRLIALEDEISTLNLLLKKLENENTEESYKESKNLREYKTILEEKKLNLEDIGYDKGGETDGNYTEYEMVVLSKDADGKSHKYRFLISARNMDEANQIATDGWHSEFGDMGETFDKVMTDSKYRMDYGMADGGELNGNLYRVGYLKVYENDEEGDTVYTKEIYGDSEEDVSSKFKKIHPKHKIEFISKYADGGEVDFSERMAKMRSAYENLNMIVKSRIAVAIGIDRAISIMENDYSIDPFGLITSAVRGGLLELDEINKDLVNEAVYEAERVTDDYRDSGQGISGSDMTYFTKSVLDSAGYKTGFVNNRLTRVDADGNELVIDKYEMNY